MADSVDNKMMILELHNQGKTIEYIVRWLELPWEYVYNYLYMEVIPYEVYRVRRTV